jgi:hypothetical protein
MLPNLLTVRMSRLCVIYWRDSADIMRIRMCKCTISAIFECTNKQDIILLRESNFLCSGLDLLEDGIVEVEVEAGTQIQLFQLLHVKSCDVEH